VEVVLQNPAQVTLVYDDQMIQTFPSDTSYQSFREAIGESYQMHPVVTVHRDTFG
jgi:hypothetical protein